MSSKASSTDPPEDQRGAEGFASFLSAVRELPLPAGVELVVAPRLGSTNALGSRVAGDYFRDSVEPPRCLIAAWQQSSGRGRRGRTWASPPGHGLYASLLLPVSGESTTHTVPLLAAVGLCRAIGSHLPDGAPPCRLKWPNDLLLDGRKLGGLLIEAVQGSDGETALVIGFGINYRDSADMRQAAGEWGAVALSELVPAPPSLAELLGDLVTAMTAELDRRQDEGYARQAYEEHSMHRPGDRLRCRDGARTVSGEFVGFDEHGFLRLRTDEGEEVRLAAGEVAT